MYKLSSLSGKELIKFLEFNRFHITRKKGSHVRLRAEDGRATTVPLHGNNNIPKGLLRKIIREDMEISFKEFLNLYSKYRKKT